MFGSKRSYLQVVKNDKREILVEDKEILQIEKSEEDFDLGLESEEFDMVGQEIRVPVDLTKKRKTQKQTVLSNKKGSRRNFIVKNKKINNGDFVRKDKSHLGKCLGVIYNNNEIWAVILSLIFIKMKFSILLVIRIFDILEKILNTNDF